VENNFRFIDSHRRHRRAHTGYVELAPGRRIEALLLLTAVEPLIGPECIPPFARVALLTAERVDQATGCLCSPATTGSIATAGAVDRDPYHPQPDQAADVERL
jgi:hypothetical protein